MNAPRPKPQESLAEVIRRAFDGLEGRDAEELARECGGRLSASAQAGARGRAVEVECLGRTLVVDLGAREVRVAGEDSPAVEGLAAVAARYVMLAGRLAREPGPEIGFADWPAARNYVGPFKGRALGALIGTYGRDPGAFARAAEAAGGERVEVEASGAVAYRLRVFPRAPVTVVLHPADEELPADAQMLFPRGLFEAFAPDDVVFFGELAARAIRGKLWPAAGID